VHVQAHLKFANDHLDDPEEEWEKVMWSAETKIELFGLNSICHVWRKSTTPRTPYQMRSIKVETSFFGMLYCKGDRTTAPY